MHRRFPLTFLTLLAGLLLSCGVWAARPVGDPVARTGANAMTVYVKVAATGNITLSSPGATIDGVSMSAGDRVLLPLQSVGSQVGIYVWNGAASTMTRAPDADESTDFQPGMIVSVVLGTINGGRTFIFRNTAYPTLGSTTLVFTRPTVSEPMAAVQLLNASTRIDCGANTAASRTIPIGSAVVGTGVTITAVPQILAGADGQLCYVRGTSDTQTVTLSNGNGINLRGQSTLVFDSQALYLFQYVLAETEWRLVSGSSMGGSSTDTMNTVHQRGGEISSATVLNPVSNKDPGSAAKKVEYWAGGLFIWDVLGVDGQPISRVRKINADKYDAIECGGVECERLTGAGVHSYSGVGKPVKAIWLDAAALTPDGTNCGVPTEQTLNSGPKTWAFQCGDSTSSVFYGKVSMHRTGWDALALSATIHLWHGTTEALTWAADISAMCRGDGDVIDNTWGTAVAIDTSITTANRMEKQTSAAFTPNGSCLPGDMLIFRVVIDAATFSANAANTRVLGLSLHPVLKTRNGLNE